MANKKISALSSSTTPLAGTEVLPIVQSSATVQVSVANLTAGRDISASGATFTKAGVTQVTIANTTGTTKNTQLIYADNVGSKWRLGMDVATNNNTNNFQLYSDVGSAAYLTMSSGGDLTLNVGNLVQGTAAKGINFTANTPAAGMTSQLLNWYEEGTFTPTIAGSGTSGTGTYTTQVGRYTRIGRSVSFQVTLAWTNLTGATGILVMNGLPFTSANVTGLATPVTTIADSVALTAGYYMQNFIFANSTQVAIRQFPAGNGTAAAVGLVTSGTIYLSGTYIV